MVSVPGLKAQETKPLKEETLSSSEDFAICDWFGWVSYLINGSFEELCHRF